MYTVGKIHYRVHEFIGFHFNGRRQNINHVKNHITEKLQIDFHVIEWIKYLITYNPARIVAPTDWLLVHVAHRLQSISELQKLLISAVLYRFLSSSSTPSATKELSKDIGDKIVDLHKVTTVGVIIQKWEEHKMALVWSSTRDLVSWGGGWLWERWRTNPKLHRRSLSVI